MAKNKYGDEMKKVVRFIPKGQTEMVDIYSQLENDTYEQSGQESRRFTQDKYFSRPGDDDYEDSFADNEPMQKEKKRRKGSKRNPNIKNKSRKKRNRESDEFESKVVAKEKRTAFLESIKPRKEVWRVAGISLAMGICLTVLISFFNISSKVAEMRYENITLRQEYENKLYEKKELETRLESSNRSDRIEEIARTALGMDYPRPDQIVYIKSN